MDHDLVGLRRKVADKLVSMEKWFKPGCKLTFIMRNADIEDGHMIITNDSFEPLIEILQLELKREKPKGQAND